MATNEELIVKVNELLAEVAADKAKAKAKEASEAWTKAAAISLVIIAVLGATAVQRSGSFGSRSLKHLNSAIYHQVEASNEWSFFQAKSTKANIYELGAEEVKAMAPGVEQAKALAEIGIRAQRYRQEQEPIKLEATRFEKLRDQENLAAQDNGEAGAKLGLAVLSFQVAVALGSICLVTKKKMLWYATLALAATATAQMLYVLFVVAPAH